MKEIDNVTLQQAVADQQTVTSSGVMTRALSDGVTIHESPLHIDDRGSVVEMFDPRWNWHPDPHPNNANE